MNALHPELHGYRFVTLLGTGGFGDVFLYEEVNPPRQVAVKVLRETDADAVALFSTEAQRMARLGTHENIVTIHAAATAPDGRAYFTMPYYKNGTLADLLRAGTGMSVEKALDMGIKLASAVETAHRAHTLHRDIKPGNILIDDYRRPILTDFGISGERGAATSLHAFSTAWAPREAHIAEQPDRRYDVYSLAALVYAMLACRGPHTSPGATDDTIRERVISGAPPLPHGRSDVPRALDSILQRALSAERSRRFATARELGEALQGVQRAAGVPVTPMDFPDEDVTVAPSRSVGGYAEPDHGDARTVVKGGSATGGSASGGSATGGSATNDARGDRHPYPRPLAEWTRHGLRDPGDSATLAKPRADDPTPAAATPAPTRQIWLPVSIGAVLVVALLAVGARVATSGGDGDRDPTAPAVETADALIDRVPEVGDLAVIVSDDGLVSATWTNPAPQPGDQFSWARTDAGAAPDIHLTTETSVDAGPVGQGPACLEVIVRRANGKGSDPVRACSP